MSKENKKPYTVHSVAETSNYFIRKNDIPLAMVYNEKMANKIANLLNTFSGKKIISIKKAMDKISEQKEIIAISDRMQDELMINMKKKEESMVVLKNDLKKRLEELDKSFDKQIRICNAKRYALDEKLAEREEIIMSQKRKITGLFILSVSLIVILIFNFIISLF